MAHRIMIFHFNMDTGDYDLKGFYQDISIKIVTGL